MTTTRFLVGIDLGTTNSALAYIDLLDAGTGRRAAHDVRLFAVPQLVAPGEERPRDSLPSFLYFPPADGASDAGDNPVVVGAFAREQGALLPTRQISSAKSWLSHPSVDRSAPILPWGSDEPFMSPVQASAAILAHLRGAWNREFGGGGDGEWRLERQEVVLTVPASFDQEARELTLQAAREAGLEHVTLLEEPLAAFYAWLSRNPGAFRSPRRGAADQARRFQDGDQILVCDVGGGTSDFTLIRLQLDRKEVSLERTAVGEHLLLGGDNLDLALARQLEHKLGDRALSLVQRLALRRSVSAAKERLLADPSTESVSIAVLGSGRALVGGSVSVTLTREEVVKALTEGFLPLVDRSAKPARDRRAALRELGLPYAEDPAITRHLAAFLRDAAADRAEGAEARSMQRADAVLFNGGFFTPAIARERVLDNLARWLEGEGESWRPKVLENEAPAAAVALGAAHYAYVRRTGGLKVRAGSSRGYYIGVEAAGSTGLSILPRGTEEGTVFDLGDREFGVITNRPVSFPLFSSAIRHDPVGATVSLTGDDFHAHAPLATVLRYGKRSRQVELAVSLSATFTETGTLEVSCASRSSEHRWRLQFQLRGERSAPPADDEAEAEAVVATEALDAAKQAMVAVFGPPGADPPALAPESLPAYLEATIGFGRHAWPLQVIRALADVLLDHAEGRKKGARFEARWLNLLGFCLRPGFGASLDDWRVGRARAIYVEGLTFPNDLQCQAEWIVLWQRVAGGLKAGQQRELYQKYSALLDLSGKKRGPRLNPQIQRESWRLLASLEQLSARERATLGDLLLYRIAREPDNASYLWAIGRFGAREPVHGPVTAVIAADRAAEWIRRLFSLRSLTGDVAAAIAQVGGRTGDPLRDVDEAVRSDAAARLSAAGFDRDADMLRDVQPPTARDALRLFGEEMPVGLRLRQ